MKCALDDLRRAEIERYVASGEPMDKAGAYGIQGLGAGLVESVTGSHTAVVGLPLTETIEALAELGVPPHEPIGYHRIAAPAHRADRSAVRSGFGALDRSG